MNTIINNSQLSFWQLISNTSKIEIPIIQRDYAQGREDEKTNKIRKRFIKKLITAIVTDDSSLELDFVYGNIDNCVFQPLDGQQRLTTLFLIHWYIAQKLGKLSETKNEFLKFTYETRISSREFCNELANKGKTLGSGKTISEQIKDSAWFFLSWEKDPTIKAMLTMLNGIEEEIKRYEKFNFQESWTKLTSENSPITFHFKELNNIGLTDDLYIKMNARGKELTEFEHFKAQFMRYINEDNEENQKKDWEKELIDKPLETFSHKIDTIWTDLFWKHRGDDNLVDNELVNFIAGIAINCYAQKLEMQKNKEIETIVKKELQVKSKGKSVTDEAIKRERIEQRIAVLFNNPNDVCPEDFPNKETFAYLKKCFDKYSEKQNSIFLNDELHLENVTLWDYCNGSSNIFKEFIKDKETTYKQRVLFFAQTEYLLNTNTFNTETFSDWLRVVRNIIQNSTIDSAGTFIGAISLISELAKGCNKIYQYLSTNSIISSFSKDQIKEEILKSKIIADLNSNKGAIFAAEDTNFCKGRIKFTLYCIGFENEKDSFDVKALYDITKVITEHLSNSDISNDFRRALFTIKDNKFYNYWSTSWLYAVNAPKRCLIENTSELINYSYNMDFRDYLKEILLKLISIKLSDLVNNYIIPDNMPHWKERIIKEEGLLGFSNRHFIAVDEDKCCWLIPQSKVANSKEGVKKLKKII